MGKLNRLYLVECESENTDSSSLTCLILNKEQRRLFFGRERIPVNTTNIDGKYFAV